MNMLKGSCNYELSKKEQPSDIPVRDPFPEESKEICPVACEDNGDCVACGDNGDCVAGIYDNMQTYAIL